MPIAREHRWLYPIDWRELSAFIRFGRANFHRNPVDGLLEPFVQLYFCAAPSLANNYLCRDVAPIDDGYIWHSLFLLIVASPVKQPVL